MSVSSAANFIPDFTICFESAQTEGARVVKAPDQGKLLEQFYQRGFSEGQAEATARYEEELAEKEQQFTHRLEEAQNEWKAELADDFISTLTLGLQGIKDDVADGVAMVLRRYIDEQTRLQMLQELTDALSAILNDETVSKIEISGAPGLLDLIKERLPDTVPAISWRENERAEVQVKVDSTVLETRISDWLSRIGEVM